MGRKTHGKMTLVVREEHGGIRRYCHLGTGNYNRDTARIYEDLGLLSTDAALGDDVSELFNTSPDTAAREVPQAPGRPRRTAQRHRRSG